MKNQYIRKNCLKRGIWIVAFYKGRLDEKKGVDNPMYTMKIRYNFLKVELAQNIIGEVSFKVAKKKVGWLVSNKEPCSLFIGPVL